MTNVRSVEVDYRVCDLRLLFFVGVGYVKALAGLGYLKALVDS